MRKSTKSIVHFFLGVLFLAEACPALAPAKLKYSFEFIQQHVLVSKNKTLRSDIERPKIFYASRTPLRQFQDAIEPQWGFRPEVITNAYVVANNEIYLLDEASYYKKNKRCIDDSLVHELTHYVQAKYQNFDMNDESLEWEAIDIQNQFREKFCKSEN